MYIFRGSPKHTPLKTMRFSSTVEGGRAAVKIELANEIGRPSEVRPYKDLLNLLIRSADTSNYGKASKNSMH